GSGSTSAIMVRKLGEAVGQGLSIKGVASSDATARLAQEVGIPLISLEEAITLDINIDGADEFNPDMQLIKGGGGALLREKILAHNSKFNVIIADSGKQVKRLGAFKLPVEIIPFAAKPIFAELDGIGLKPQLRQHDGVIYSTDENNHILDLDILGWEDVQELERKLKSIPGIVETGLFLDSTDLIILGKGERTVLIKKS
ncbi:MAG: ribose-5-phosphate isomerase RpiA, partial [Pricia sp.]|nr:ribose-5-phosphate isomerase RpiA [Pricia sp.]